MPNDVKNISGNLIKQPAEEFQVRSASAAVGFNTEDAPPPIGTYIGVDDQLFLQCASFWITGTITVNLRILGPDGIIIPMTVTVATFANRAFLTSRFPLKEGWLLSASATSGGALNNSQWAYLSVSIQRTPFGANSQYELLMAGYLNSSVPMSYPVSVPQRPLDGGGALNSFNQAAPAAGADLVITVPAGARWRLLSFRATLTTAVAAANRLVSLTLDDGANIYAESPSNFTQVASIVNTYNAFDSAPYLAAPFNLRTLQPLPSNQFMGPTHRLSTSTTGIQAADQWSAARVLAVEWLENT